MSFATAQAIADSSLTTAERALVVREGEVSTIMVKTLPTADAHQVALAIAADVPGVVPVESPSLFGAFRKQVTGMLWGAAGLTFIFWGVAVYFIGLIFLAAAAGRRREVAVLRALGASRRFVFLTLLGEAAVLALGGGLLGTLLASFGAYLFGDFITSSLGIPFLFPSFSSWLGLTGVGTLAILATVTLAALLPALRMSRQEPALAVRE